ncbi:MAG TPA: surface-adhesin E family protein [Caulobacteraceae bacterium]|jgi:hypothetical protein
MISATLIAAALALTPVQNSHAPRPSWGADVTDGDWKYIGPNVDDTSMLFVKNAPGRSADGNPRLWVRQEFSEPRGKMVSSRMLMEVDCMSAYWRTSQIAAFSERNLEGDKQSANKLSDWTSVTPNTFAEEAWHVVCVSGNR